MKLMLLGVGTRVEHIKLMRKAGFDIWGTDMNPMAPGLDFCQHPIFSSYKFNDDKFWAFAAELIDEYKIEAIMPASHFSLMPLHEHRNDIPEGCKVVLPDRKVTEICEDKKLTYARLNDLMFPTVPQREETDYPLIMRPRTGAGNRMTQLIQDETDLIYWKGIFKKNKMDYVCTKPIDAFEYTVDFLADEGSIPIYVVPRRRIEHKAGEVWKTKVIHRKYIEVVVSRIIVEMNLKYIGFVQLFLDKGQILINEIDSRFGGGSSCSVLAGADLFGGLKAVLRGKSAENIKAKTWSSAWFSRYLNDYRL